MIRKVFYFPLWTLLFATSFPLDAQQQRTIPKIGFMGVRPDVSDQRISPLHSAQRANGAPTQPWC
jgi:hypothetical protein